MSEIIFEITEDVAECLTENIATQGDTWEELRSNVKEAVAGYFFDSEKPAAIRLHLVRNEVLLSA